MAKLQHLEHLVLADSVQNAVSFRTVDHVMIELQFLQLSRFLQVRNQRTGRVFKVGGLADLVSREIKHVQRAVLLQLLHDVANTAIAQLTVVQVQYFQSAHRRNGRGQVL